MATRAKILIIERNIDLLSKIYLTLVHRNYKAEALDDPGDMTERIRKFKPAVIVLNLEDYQSISDKLKTPAVVMADKNQLYVAPGDPIFILEKPIHLDQLIPAIEKLVI